MRGSTPLDVAASSVMDNNGLALALEEPDLEKVKEKDWFPVLDQLITYKYILMSDCARRWLRIWQAVASRAARCSWLKGIQTLAGTPLKGSATFPSCDLRSSSMVRLLFFACLSFLFPLSAFLKGRY